MTEPTGARAIGVPPDTVDKLCKIFAYLDDMNEKAFGVNMDTLTAGGLCGDLDPRTYAAATVTLSLSPASRTCACSASATKLSGA